MAARRLTGRNPKRYLPDQLESELDLPGRRRSTGDDTGSGGGGSARGCKCDQVWGVEVCMVQNIEELRTKLEVQFLPNLRVLE